jgi:FKBP-type peptidyl-prolyl cis-trans isomerase
MLTRSLVLFAVLASAGGFALAQAPATPPAAAATQPSAFKSDAQRIGYAIGLQIGKNLQGVDVDSAALGAGIKDAASGAKPQMTEDQVDETMIALQKQVLAAKQQAGEKFMAENAKKDGVKTTASGLQYRVIKSGAGKTPKATDTVSVNYRGTLVTGEEFDSSKGTPVTFPVNGVIPGWTEALQLMKEGDKWEVVIPSKLAYGERGAGREIGPNSTLVFEVELVSVKSGQ